MSWLYTSRIAAGRSLTRLGEAMATTASSLRLKTGRANQKPNGEGGPWIRHVVQSRANDRRSTTFSGHSSSLAVQARVVDRRIQHFTSRHGVEDKR